MNSMLPFTFIVNKAIHLLPPPIFPPSTRHWLRIRSRISVIPPPPPPPRVITSIAEAAVAGMASTSLTACGSSDDAREAGDALVQYVVLRRDLIDAWPLGSVVTQGCHASVAAIWSYRDRVDTGTYLSATNLDFMNKVMLEVKGEIQMRNLAEKLTAKGIEHRMWIEQPENIPTCLATRPYRKSCVASYFKKLKLCK